MSRIQQQEADLYSTAWTMGGYGEFSPGEKYAQVFAELVPAGATVLDAGCGSGKGAAALHGLGYKVMMCDLTMDGVDPEIGQQIPFFTACLWKDMRSHPGRWGMWGWDYVYCCDVMEHIHPQFTMLIVQNLLNIVQNGVFFSISLTHDQFGYFAGEPLHKTVQSFGWWKDNLNELGRVTEARDLGNTGLYLVIKK